MWSDLIVFPTPDLGQHLCLLQRREILPVEEFIPELSVEAFDVTVLPFVRRLLRFACEQPRSPALSAEQGRDPAVTISTVMPCQRDDAGGQEDLIICHPGRVSLGASYLSQHTASPTFGNGQYLADVLDRLTSTRRAQKFPRAVSFRIERSRAWSATSLFNRWFSRSSSFRRRAWETSMPPYSLRQR